MFKIWTKKREWIKWIIWAITARKMIRMTQKMENWPEKFLNFCHNRLVGVRSGSSSSWSILRELLVCCWAFIWRALNFLIFSKFFIISDFVGKKRFFPKKRIFWIFYRDSTRKNTVFSGWPGKTGKTPFFLCNRI